MIAVIDYGVGNLYSLQCSLRHIGAKSVVTRDPEAIARADQIILPGVGAFGDATDQLRALRLDALLVDQARAGKPLLGVCLGMQILFDRSLEYGEHKGLGLIGGAIRPLAPDVGRLKVPHMGWNSLRLRKPDDPLLVGAHNGDAVYYVHSFYATDCAAATVAESDYGVAIPGLVRAGNVCGAQFHPEKSGPVGLRMLKAFAEEETPC